MNLVERRVHKHKLHRNEHHHDDTEKEALQERSCTAAVVEPDENGACDEDKEDEDYRVGLVELEEVALVEAFKVNILELLRAEHLADCTPQTQSPMFAACFIIFTPTLRLSLLVLCPFVLLKAILCPFPCRFVVVYTGCYRQRALRLLAAETL